MKLIRMLGVAALSAIMVAFSAAAAVAGDNSGARGAGYTATSVTIAADTPDGTAVGVLCGGHRYGSFNWNDYADDDPSDDIDNVTVYDQAGDGMSLRVVVTNSNGRDNSATARYGQRVSIDVGNVKNGGNVSVKAVPWNNGAPACSPSTDTHF